MAQLSGAKNVELGPFARFVAWLGRIFLAAIIPLLSFYVLYQGFMFLRDSAAPRWVIITVAIVWGVGGVALLYWVFNRLVGGLPTHWTERLQPFVFVGPAIAIMMWDLTVPVLRTFWLSLFGPNGPPRGACFIEALQSTAFVGLGNYYTLVTERLP